MAREKVEALTDGFYESALYYLCRQQKCRSRAEVVRMALMIAARAKGWRGPSVMGDFPDHRFEDYEERMRRIG